MIEITQDALRRVFPGARPEYLSAFVACKPELDAAGVTESPLRWSHFLGQIGAETGGLKIVREDMRYRADRILQVFGRGKHSARVTPAEAQRLAGDAEALAERVYGLGNPSMAKRLGNDEEGDGYAYRGWGPGQITGKGKSIEYGERMGLDFEIQPELLEDAAVGLKAMLMEWREKDCNKFADGNQIGCISRAINLGNPYAKATPNGMANRQAAYDKAWSVYRDASGTEAHILRKGDQSDDVKDLQEMLANLGYFPGFADSKFGPKTEDAVLIFQKDHGLVPDGKVGKRTWGKLREAKPREQGDRAFITPQTLLERGSLQVASAQKIKRTGVTLLTSGLTGVAVLNAIPQTVNDLPDAIRNFTALGESLGSFTGWLATPNGAFCAVLAVAAWFGLSLLQKGAAVINQRVEEARSGANVSK